MEQSSPTTLSILISLMSYAVLASAHRSREQEWPVLSAHLQLQLPTENQAKISALEIFAEWSKPYIKLLETLHSSF